MYQPRRAVAMLEATLSFLGVGPPINKPSLGMMISPGKNYIYAGKWWLVIFPRLQRGKI
jgi:peptide/nickel transport system permease protein